MRTRRNHSSATDGSSLVLVQKFAAMIGVVTACAAALGGACGDPQSNTTGTGGAGTSSSGKGGTGEGGCQDLCVIGSSVAIGSSSSNVSSSGPLPPPCPMGDPNGGPTDFAAEFGDANGQTGSAIAFDSVGNILLAGSFGGSITFGGTTLTSAGADDVFVAKFTPAGQIIWAKAFGDGGIQTASGIGVDANGNVYVTGSFKGSINFGGGALAAAGTLFLDVYLAKLTSDGNHVWSKKFGDDNVQNARSLSVDAAGNVVIAGFFQNNIDFGGGTLTSAGLYDAFAAKFDPTGMHTWSRRFGDAAGDQYGRAVTLDAAGNVYLAGDAGSAIDFGGGPMSATSVTNAFVAKLDTAGNMSWAKLSKGTAMDKAYGNAIAVGSNGDVAVGGNFRGTFDLGGTPVTNAGPDDAYVTVFSAAGAHTYTKTFGDSESQTVTGVAIPAAGEVLIAGNFSGSIDLGTGMPSVSAGAFDGYLARLNSKGCPTWLRTFPGAMVQLTQGLAFYPNPNPMTARVALTGSFNGTVDFGAGAVTASGDDVFLLSVKP